MQPAWYQILLASLAVLAGCVVSAYSFWIAVRHHNWLFHILGVGAALFVVGMVGERTPVAGTGRPSSVWDLTVQVPLLPLKLDELAIAGLILLLLGVSVVLFVERVVPPEQRWQPPPHRAIDEDDSV
jgi:drug/metabolite transporter superfamily protein YnfA